MLLSGKNLDRAQFQEFSVALNEAFNLDDFDQMLRYHLNKKRENIILEKGSGLLIIIDKVIEKAEQEGWTAELLQAARITRPENVQIFFFAQKFGLSPMVAQTHSALERTIRESNSYFDLEPWIADVTKIETQLCRIEATDGTHLGTGFLAGPAMVMTNYHVVEDVFANKRPSDSILFRFDYKVMSDGTTLNSGNKYRLLQPNWYKDYSEYNPLEFQGALPSEDQLDYVLLNVENMPIPNENPASLQVNMPNITQRGWIKPSAQDYIFQPHTPLFILHHPTIFQNNKVRTHLVCSIDTDAVIGMNQNSTRVRYKTNTENGSSGAPCFNASWELIALHHAGDPNYEKFHKPEYNQGIPFSMIVNLLKSRGKLNALSVSQDKELSDQHSKNVNNTQNPINLESYTEKQEISQLSPYEQACKHFRKAWTCLEKARAPLQENMYIPPSVFRTSIEDLQEMQTSVKKIIECLQNTSSLPSDVAENQIGIVHELRKVDLSIARPLLLSLQQNKRGNFISVLNLMQTIGKKLLLDF